MLKIGKEFSLIDPPTCDTFLRVIYSTKSTYQMQRIDHSRANSSPNSKCIGSIHCGPTTHADKGRQYRPLRRFQLPSPIMDLLLVITVASNPSSFFLNEQYRPKIYGQISKRCDRGHERERETCLRQFNTNSRLTRGESKEKKKKKKK